MYSLNPIQSKVFICRFFELLIQVFKNNNSLSSMFDPISPQKENIVSNADVLKISSDTKKYIPAFSTSPKSMNVAPK